jgi:Rrf2 family protein
MTFNKTTTYAILVLAHMAEDAQKMYSASYLSKTLGIPLQYCRQLLTDLSKSDLVKSVHGRTGGFSLSRSIDKIFLSQIVDAVEGMENFHKCIMGFEECPYDNKCALHDVWERTRNEFIEILLTTSLRHFLKKEATP